MSKVKLLVALAVLAVAFAATACNVSVNVSTANIRSATLSPNESGSPATTVFKQDDYTVYCLADLANAPDSTVVKAVWTAVDVEGVDANTVIDEASVTGGDADLTFDLTNSKPWPLGKYKVDLYINDKFNRTLEYQVK